MTEDLEMKCEVCSRRAFQGHNPTCPNNPSNKPAVTTIEQVKLDALREAWIDVPQNGVVPTGNGEWLQNLINAVTEIVDPDGALLHTPEVERRGSLAMYRSQFVYWTDQVKQSKRLELPAEVEKYQAKLDDVIAGCRADHGIELENAGAP